MNEVSVNEEGQPGAVNLGGCVVVKHHGDMELLRHREVEQAAQLWRGEVVAIELDHPPAPVSVAAAPANRHRGVLPRASSLIGGSGCFLSARAPPLSARRRWWGGGVGGAPSFFVLGVL